MKKFVNRVDDVLTEALRGFGAAHELRGSAGRVSRRRDDGLVETGIAAPAERAPADLEGTETQRLESGHRGLHRRRLLHEERAIRQHAVAISATEQSTDRLPHHLSEDIPKRDVDAADGMSQRSAHAHPETVLRELFRNAFRLERMLAPIERLENTQRRFDQQMVREDTAVADDPLVGVHGDEGVDAVLGLEFDRPAAFRRLAHQANASYRDDFHSLPSVRRTRQSIDTARRGIAR